MNIEYWSTKMQNVFSLAASQCKIYVENKYLVFNVNSFEIERKMETLFSKATSCLSDLPRHLWVVAY